MKRKAIRYFSESRTDDKSDLDEIDSLLQELLGLGEINMEQEVIEQEQEKFLK